MHIEKKKNSPRRPYISPKEPIIITPCFSGMHCRKLFNIIGLFLAMAMVDTVSLKLFYSVTEQWSTDGKRTVPVGPHNISGLTVKQLSKEVHSSLGYCSIFSLFSTQFYCFSSIFGSYIIIIYVLYQYSLFIFFEFL